MTRNTLTTPIAAAALALLTALTPAILTPAMAADHQVQMLNKGEAGAMVFEPALIEAAPGDTVTFVATDKGHNAETIKGLIPEGAEAFKSAFGKDFTVTVDAAGVYAVKCTPHYPMGMVALIVVDGDLGNLDAVKAGKYPGKAKARMADLFAELGQ
ncbi:pseudoazurin [Cucumibacter marinus]|uniref:pseudoazurin n=1 Tax=Cucumibacter marinus TaxID=1121252 RepID=UPI000407DDC5|nr:pseudoazurin [Cucumibacter marinus]